MKNQRFFKALLLIAALTDTFYAGIRTQAYLYEDLCLDLDGSKNSGDYPICVLDKNVADGRPK